MSTQSVSPSVTGTALVATSISAAAKQDSKVEKLVQSAIGKANEGADEVDAEGRNAIHRAVLNHKLKKLRLLVSERKDLLEKVDIYGNTPLMLAANAGNFGACEILLAAGADPTKSKNGLNAFHIAIKNGNKEIVQLLVVYPQLLEVKTPDGDTPLILSARFGYLQICIILLAACADYSAVDKRGKNAFLVATERNKQNVADFLRIIAYGTQKYRGKIFFHAAVIMGESAHVQILLKANKRLLELEDEYGNTPLFQALREEHNSISRILIAAGANLSKKGKKENALHIAVQMGNSEIVYLILKANIELIESLDEYGNTPLILCADSAGGILRPGLKWGYKGPEKIKRCFGEICVMLLEAGANINAKNKEGMTPLEIIQKYEAWEKDFGDDFSDYKKVCQALTRATVEYNKIEWPNAIHRAIRDGDNRLLQQAIQQEPHLINSTNKRGYTPLMWAAYYGKLEACKILLQAKADVNLISLNKRNVLHLAIAGKGDPKVVQFFASFEHLRDSKDANEGDTPLILAAWYGQRENCEILLNAGAKVRIKNNKGEDALSIARGKKKEAIVKLLEEHLNKTSSSVHPTLKRYSMAFYSIDTAITEGRKPILKAMKEGNIESFQALIDQRKDLINSIDENGNTFLMLAAYGGNTAVCKILLTAGANVELTNALGQNVLHQAATSGHTDIIELFAAYKNFLALLNSQDKSGDTPLMVAAYYGHDLVCKTFLRTHANTHVVNHRGKSALDIAKEQAEAAVVRVLEAHLKTLGSTPPAAPSATATAAQFNRALEHPLQSAIGQSGDEIDVEGRVKSLTSVVRSSIVKPLTTTISKPLTLPATQSREVLAADVSNPPKPAESPNSSAIIKLPPGTETELLPLSVISRTLTQTTQTPVIKPAVDPVQPKPSITALPNGSPFELLALSEQQRLLAENQAQLARAVKKLEVLDLSSLQKLQGSHDQFNRLFEMDAKADQIDAERSMIDAHVETQTYYRYFCRCLTGIWMACQTISSGMVANAKMENIDYAAAGIAAIGNSVPGFGALTAIFSGIISSWSSRQKMIGVQRVALLYPDLETAFKELGKLARYVTIAQKDAILKIDSDPMSFLTKVKVGAKDLKASILGEDIKGPLKQKVKEDCEKILKAIMEEKPKPNPSILDLLTVIMGAGFVYKGINMPAASQARSVTSPLLSPVSPSISAAGLPTSPVATASPSSREILARMQQMEIEHRRMNEQLAQAAKRDQERDELIAKLKEEVRKVQHKPFEDEMVVGGDMVQEFAIRRTALDALNMDASPAALHRAKISDEIGALRTEIIVHKARLEEHADEIHSMKARLKDHTIKSKK